MTDQNIAKNKVIKFFDSVTGYSTVTQNAKSFVTSLICSVNVLESFTCHMESLTLLKRAVFSLTSV
ncbi:hypothetical protein J6590_071873 [Homalodisca vitripennis]|nr:hypothetical protein J6590_071873 [Homalodisca vitripennis]